MNVFINYSTLTALCATSNGGQSLQKLTGQLLAAMQANLYKMYRAYLVNIFATLNNLNLEMQECYYYTIIAFHSSINVFKVTLKLWQTHIHIKNMVSFLALNEL